MLLRTETVHDIIKTERQISHGQSYLIYIFYLNRDQKKKKGYRDFLNFHSKTVSSSNSFIFKR